MLAGADATPQTFVNSHKTLKFTRVFLKVSRYTLIKLGIGKGCLLQPWQECLRSVFLMQYQLVSMATSGDQRVKLTLKGTYFKFNSFVTVFPWHQYLK